MRIFVFEYTTGGGLLAERPEGSSAAAPLQSLATEGGAMVAALAYDFAQLPGVRVSLLRDARLSLTIPAEATVKEVQTAGEYADAFDAEARAADWTVVIAPECDGVLVACVERVIHCGGRLLGPDAELARLAADKQATAEHLSRAGVPVPRGCLLRDAAHAELRMPLVLKRRDGAGSQGMRLLASAPELAQLSLDGDRWRVEEFQPGTAASVALLCGPTGAIALPACAQRLSSDGQFRYLGGSLPLDFAFDKRARQLAARAAAALPVSLGYLGVDLILGDRADGSDDVAIEVNPRLTTSYVGLRAAAQENLAGALVAMATGNTPTLTFGRERVEFTADGAVHRPGAVNP